MPPSFPQHSWIHTNSVTKFTMDKSTWKSEEHDMAFHKMEFSQTSSSNNNLQQTGLFKHISRPIQFTLVVHNFGIKYIGQEHLDHLLQSIRKHYDVKVDLTGSLYCGITLHWDYNNKHLDISMPGYVNKQLTKYNHLRPKKPVATLLGNHIP
eukprot:CCRYP_018106-RB/>CCRYP_018106-RB protein AED:0.46 eAED:0.46 QI:0/0/0/1/0/0/2/0/151